MTTNKTLSDYLSPMLVKELRQGLRRKSFIGSFILTQLLMVVVVCTSLMAAEHGRGAEQQNLLFWTMIGLPLLGVMPWRGLEAIREEVRQNTLELVFLTRLTAWRIVCGKWLAHLFLAVLLATTVLPYVVLRYFLGGVNLISDLVTLGFMLAASLLLGSITIAQSSYRKTTQSDRGIRKVVNLIVAAFLFYFGAIVLFSGISRGVTRGIDRDIIAGALLFGPGTIAFMLTIAASKIAPPAENYSFRKRIIGLIFLLVTAILLSFDVNSTFVFGCAGTIMLVIWLDAITEEVKLIPSIYTPFVNSRFGSLNLRFLFYPGWCFAVFYVLTTASLLFAMAILVNPSVIDHLWAFSLAAIGSLLLPLAIIKLAIPEKRSINTPYWVIQLCIVIFIGIASAVLSALKIKADWISSVLPHTALLSQFRYHPYVEVEGLIPLSLTTVICLVILIYRMKRPLSQIRAIEAEIRKDRGQG